MLISQDEKQQAANLMTFYLYDKMHRLVVKGECEIPLNFAGAEQATICTYTGPGTGIDGCGYTANFNFPSPVLQLVNFYDDYSFRTGTGFNNTNFPAPVGHYSCGKKTGSIVYVPGQDTRLYKAYYYSMRGNLIREVSSNLRGGYDTTETTYSFTDRPSHSTHTHTAQNAPTLTEAYDYTYDHADRLTKVEHTFGGVKQTLLAHAYDELCRLSHTDYHGSSANRLTYSYNTRGWLTAISGNKFSQNLYYNTGNGTPCYNGNISSMTWKAGNETTLRGYKFTYDGLNRMLDAVYGEGTSLNSNANRFTEKVTGYDKNGNILALQRYGQTGTSSYGLIDNLTFTLDGNQLNRVDDAVTASAYNNGFEFKDAVKQANEYAYDANGNLTKDLNKNISEIQYNCLNLPRKVTFTDGSTIEYTYAADGTKLRTKHVINGTTTTTDYCGNVIYENGVQKLLLTEAGYLTLADSKYHYYLQDHQGNNRVVIDQNGTVEETNHYYPFGGVFANSTNVQPYKYNGKELDTKKGLNWYDYGARHYDAAVGRFATVDPSSESYYETSPYAYCYNNPIKHIDPNGKDGIISIYGDNIVIRANIILTGPYATSQLAGIYKAGIMATWGKQTTYEYQDKTYNLQWDINVYAAGKDEEPNFNGVNNYMKVEMDSETTSRVKYTNQGFLRGEGRNGFNIRDDNPAPHEFGHIIGLADKYIKNGPQENQPVDDSWSNNIMGAWNGKVEKKNLDILLTQPIELYEFLMKWNKDVPWVDFMKTTYYINDKNREPK